MKTTTTTTNDLSLLKKEVISALSPIELVACSNKRDSSSSVLLCIYVCIVITYYGRLGVNRYDYESCSWSAEQGKLVFFPVPVFAPVNLVSRDGFGRPPGVSRLILPPGLNLVLTRGFLSFLPLRDIYY